MILPLISNSIASKHRAPVYCILLAVAVFLCFNVIKRSYWDRAVVTSDGYGYYSYLPAVIIYGDLQYSFFESVYRKHLPNAPVANFCNEVNGKKVNKYFAGVAVLLAPFFLTAHVISHLFGLPADGYAELYQLFVALGAIFYLGLGWWYGFKLLELYDVPSGMIFFTLPILVFGTNLFHYAAVEPSMSHVYSFAAISAFAYYVKIFFSAQRSAYILKIFICLGLIALIRPVNILVVLSLPFLSASHLQLKELPTLLLKYKRSLLAGLTIMAVIGSIQFILYYFQTGSFIVWSYQGEGFDFFKPKFFNVLFSYKKGWFVYTPVAFLSLLGFIHLFRKNKMAAVCLLAFFFLLIYVISCWWQWEYGASFGHRAFIDYYIFLLPLMAFSMLAFTSKIYKTVLVQLFVAAMAVNLIQAYQYRRFILHWDQMNKDKYWQVFLKTGKEYEGILWK